MKIQTRITTVAIVTTIYVNTAFAGILFGMTPAVQTTDPAKCLLGQGFWKTHPAAWPMTSLTIGGKTYTEAQLLTILATPVKGNATLILADQLIPALLNIADGSSPTPVAATIADAQSLLVGVNLLSPAAVQPSSSSGQRMISDADVLGAYNSGALNTPNCSISAVTGTASLGAAIAGANVTLTDVNGNRISTTTASDGTFTLSTAALTPPFLVRVVTTSPSGGFPSGTTLYSVSADANASTTIDVHVLSDLMVRSFYSAQGIDPDSAFTNPTGPNVAPTPIAVQSLASLVIPAVQLWLNNAGVNATPGPPSNGAINLISSPFTAYPAGVTPTTGLDAALHLITSETIDPGDVTSITIGNTTVTETITPLYSDDVVTLNTVTTNTVTGVSSTASFSGLVITGANQSVVAGIDATLAAFASIVNADGSALTGSELLPIYAPDYLNDGLNAAQGAAAFAVDVAGITMNSLQVQGIQNLNTTTNVADVIVAYNITQGGANQSGTIEWFFKNEGGTWLMYGDQHIAATEVGAGARRYEGAPGGSFVGNIVEVRVHAPVGTISGATVTNDSSLKIWSAGGGLTTNTLNLPHGPTHQGFPVNQDQFSADSVPILPFPQYVVPTGTPFTFTVTPVSGPAVQYTVPSNADSTDTIAITSPTTTGLVNAHLGSPLLVQWTIPTTFAVTSIEIDGQTFNGPENSPSTLQCTTNVNTATNATSAYITLPTTCGGLPVVNAWVNVNIGGVNGVTSGAWFFF